MSWHLYIYCGKFLMVTLGRSERLDQNVLWTVLCLALDPSLWNCLLQTHWAKLVLRTASPVPEQTTFTLWSFCPFKQHLPWVTSKTQYRSQSCGLWGWQKCSCSCWIWLANPSSAGLVADVRGSWFLGYTHCLPLLPRVSCLAPGCSKLTLQWRLLLAPNPASGRFRELTHHACSPIRRIRSHPGRGSGLKKENVSSGTGEGGDWSCLPSSSSSACKCLLIPGQASLELFSFYVDHVERELQGRWEVILFVCFEVKRVVWNLLEMHL